PHTHPLSLHDALPISNQLRRHVPSHPRTPRWPDTKASPAPAAVPGFFSFLKCTHRLCKEVATSASFRLPPKHAEIQARTGVRDHSCRPVDPDGGSEGRTPKTKVCLVAYSGD